MLHESAVAAPTAPPLAPLTEPSPWLEAWGAAVDAFVVDLGRHGYSSYTRGWPLHHAPRNDLGFLGARVPVLNTPGIFRERLYARSFPRFFGSLLRFGFSIRSSSASTSWMSMSS